MGSPEVPIVIGRYALYDRIASGGMATVHLGRLLGPVGFARTVAIKRLHPQYAQDPDFVSMFLDEARLAARIRHPNVVPTIDVVATSGELFLVMEYVQGESLARLIRISLARGEPIPPAIVTTLVSAVLHGLHAAHEARDERGDPLGIVHRDVSPQNIIVGIDGLARVLDFGVAKAAGRVHSTREGQIKGKLSYMAPEQIAGHVARTTDVYAAAVVLWEALTGRRLYTSDNDVVTMKLVLDGGAEPPSKFASGIPRALDDLTMRGLERDPKRRFPTASDMALALEDCLPPVPASRIGQWVQAAARQTLTERSDRIAHIESDSQMEAPAVPFGASPAPAPILAPASATSASEESQLTTQLSSGSFSARSNVPVIVTPPPSRARMVGVAVGCLLLGGVAVGILRTESGRAPEAAAVHATSPAPSSSPVPLPASSAVAPPVAKVVASETASAAPAAVPAPRPTATPRPPSVAPRPPASAKAACDPPFYFNAEGNRVFKRECL